MLMSSIVTVEMRKGPSSRGMNKERKAWGILGEQGGCNKEEEAALERLVYKN